MKRTMRLDICSLIEGVLKSSINLKIAIAFCFSLSLTAPVLAQHVNDRPGDEPGEWRFIGGDAGHTRSTPLAEINAENFEDIEVEWTWEDSSFGSTPPRSTPVYADGKLFTVAGARRHVVAIDPSSGETLWSFREPNTFRQEYSMRAAWGKGAAPGVPPVALDRDV